MNLNIIYEDNHIIVVLKVGGMPTQPDISGDLDLLTALKQYRVKNENKKGEAFVGMVHRLDRPTGGLMVFAKTSKAAERLSAQIRDREFEKKYLAVGVGDIHARYSASKGHLVHYLKKGDDNTVVVAPQTDTGAKRAELSYSVLETKQIRLLARQGDSAKEVKQGGTTKREVKPSEENPHELPPSEVKPSDNIITLNLFEINLITGRSHQARVQLAQIGTPLFADLRYAGSKYIKGEMGLFANYIRFAHPTTKQTLVFKAEPDLEIAPWKFFDFLAKQV
ncbi:MAG: pseudouridine synthase [Firmicutes bacterium]|nr:pseudouridine synthase [Bacillota bacterium]